MHIISISFGFPNIDQSLEPIRQALLEAHAADVLIFAAAGNTDEEVISDGGGRDWINFPACLDEVISVGSTEGTGKKKSSFVPILGPGKLLCTIGEGINAAWISPGEEFHSTMKRRAGTSYATPVAAGVAAMIIDFMCTDRSLLRARAAVPVESSKEEQHVKSTLHEYRTLRTKHGMLAVMERMILHVDSMESLVPWQLFELSQAKPSDGGERCAILDIINDLLRIAYRPRR